jgi:hypothetical protein
MKKILVFLSLMVFGTAVFAQVAQTKLQFSATEHDFGTFKEEAGRQTFDFIVTNTGSEPLVIQNVVASCGCTTPEWTKQPIPAGAKGKVTAIYDPQGRPGAFNKTLSVYANSNPQVTVLVIKGEVTPHEKTIEELFTFAVGGVRFESQQLAFTNVKKTEKKVRVMQLINTSNAPVKVGFDTYPAYLALKISPETLKPGQKGIVEGTYDGTQNQGWGNVTDLVKIKINDAVQENLYYYISANLVENFSGLSKEELDNAPVFKLVSNTFDLGKIKGSTQNEVEFKFTNDGKRDLIIRYVRATCGCTVPQQPNQGKPIKPGESSAVKAVFNSGSYSGKVTKAIYVYSNDPKNSEVVLMLNADVEQPAVPK